MIPEPKVTDIKTTDSKDAEAEADIREAADVQNTDNTLSVSNGDDAIAFLAWLRRQRAQPRDTVKDRIAYRTIEAHLLA